MTNEAGTTFFCTALGRWAHVVCDGPGRWRVFFRGGDGTWGPA